MHMQKGGKEEVASSASATSAKLRARGLDNARDALDMLLDWVAQCGAERQVRVRADGDRGEKENGVQRWAGGYVC